MAEPRQSDVLGGLPRTRPERRSAKRPARPDGTARPSPPKPTSAKPTSAKPSPAKPSPAKPTAAKPTAAKPTAAKPAPGRRAPSSGARATGQSRPRPPAGTKPGARAAKPKANRLRQPPQPRGIPSQPRSPVPAESQRPEILGTFVQAAAELTEIGLSVGAQVLRRAVSRLPRP